MIVGSILLAFAIDAAWDARNDRVFVRGHLEALSAELSGAHGEISAAQERRQRRMQVIHHLLGVMTGGSTAPPQDTVSAWLGVLWGSSAQSRPLAALENLRSTGTLGEIESDELRMALLNYERIIGQANEVARRATDAWELELRPYLVSHSDALPQLSRSGRASLDLEPSSYNPAFESGTDALLTDRTFQNLLLVRLARMGSAQAVNSQVLDLLEELFGMLEAELQ